MTTVDREHIDHSTHMAAFRSKVVTCHIIRGGICSKHGWVEAV